MTSSHSAAGRLSAVGTQLQAVHDALRDDLDALRRGLGTADDQNRRRLTEHCVAFCGALGRHHRAEDATAFPVLAREFPQLGPTIAKLTQDHQLIADILRRIDELIVSTASTADVRTELDGPAAIMESHFRYEERSLTAALDSVRSTDTTASDPVALFGDLDPVTEPDVGAGR